MEEKLRFFADELSGFIKFYKNLEVILEKWRRLNFKVRSKALESGTLMQISFLVVIYKILGDDVNFKIKIECLAEGHLVN